MSAWFTVDMQAGGARVDHLSGLADFAAGFDARELPGEVAARTALILADTLGAMAGGAAEAEVTALAARLAGGGPVPVVGTGRRTAPGPSALLNGVSATALEMDEGNQFCKGHPGAHTIPAALAFAAGTGVSGRDLLAAIALGYEIGARVGIATRLRPAMHPHGTWGAICAAVAVARLAGRDADGLHTAMNMAASYCLATNLARWPDRPAVIFIDGDGGEEVWSFPDGRYSPAVGVEGLLILTGVRTMYGLVPTR